MGRRKEQGGEAEHGQEEEPGRELEAGERRKEKGAKKNRKRAGACRSALLALWLWAGWGRSRSGIPVGRSLGAGAPAPCESKERKEPERNSPQREQSGSALRAGRRGRARRAGKREIPLKEHSPEGRGVRENRSEGRKRSSGRGKPSEIKPVSGFDAARSPPPLRWAAGRKRGTSKQGGRTSAEISAAGARSAGSGELTTGPHQNQRLIRFWEEPSSSCRQTRARDKTGSVLGDTRSEVV